VLASVACTSAGNCSAGGGFADASGHNQAFVVSQVSGTWRTAIQVPGTATLNAGGAAWTVTVPCAAAGNCSAGGGYTDGSGASAGVRRQPELAFRLGGVAFVR